MIAVPNELTPLHSAIAKSPHPVAVKSEPGIPTVAITSASMEFISDAAKNGHGQHTPPLSTTGSANYRHLLQPQTSATPSSSSTCDQTTATESTGAGSEITFLATNSNTSLDGKSMELPNSGVIDVEDAGLEEISINPVVSFPNSTTNENHEFHIPTNGFEKNMNNYDQQNNMDLEVATSTNKPQESEEGDEEVKYPWQRPEGEGCLAQTWWLFFFPINLLFFLTIPDVRRASKHNDVHNVSENEVQHWYCCSSKILRKLTPLSFVICMAWIGAISYVVTWMITIVGYTIGVPDSVMGLSFLAVGTSVPEVFSSLIVCRQGKVRLLHSLAQI